MPRALVLALAGLVVAVAVWRISADTDEVRSGPPAMPAAAPARKPGAAVTPVPIRTLRVRGRRDRAFAHDGRATTDFDGTVNAAQAIAVGPSGTIVVAGWSSSTSEYEPDAFALSRYLPDGSLDPAFGHGGRVTTGFGVNQAATNRVNDLLVGPDERITAVGQAGEAFHNASMRERRYFSGNDPMVGFLERSATVVFSDHPRSRRCSRRDP